jgi:hypothetical protein
VQRPLNVRFGSGADITGLLAHVRLAPESRVRFVRFVPEADIYIEPAAISSAPHNGDE